MEKIKCENMSFSYPARAAKALSDITFSLDTGEFCALIGKSASGKSTLLKLLKAELAPHGTLDGSVTVNGTVGYVGQRAEESFVSDRVRGELAFSPTNAGLDGDAVELLVAETAAYFHLDAKLDAEIRTLSGGEKQILSLAAVMIMKPDVLLLDEPAAQLDPVSAALFVDILRTMHRDFHTTILMAEHTLEQIFDIADSVMLLDGGSLSFKTDKMTAAKRLVADNHEMKAALPVKYLDTVFSADDRAEITGDTVLSAKNVSFAYEKGRDILCGLNFKVYEHQINAVIGPNACGKSTLLKVLSGVKKPYRGKVKTKDSIAVLPQNVYDLFTRDTCGEEVPFGDVTARLGIDGIQDFHPYDISGGQAQRLALAKVLHTGADIILLDEPTQGFDCVLKQELAALLFDLCAAGKTIVIVTHDLQFAGDVADVCAFMSQGRIVAQKAAKPFFESLHFYTAPLVRLNRNGG